MRYITALNSIEFFSYHGLHPEEKLTGGIFLVDLKVEQEIDDEASMKRLNEVVNYEKLYEIVKKEMDKPRVLLETVAKGILDEVSSRVRRIIRVEVTITKKDPAGLFKSGSASVTLAKKYE